MSDLRTISQMLLPELEAELAITRRVLAAVPDGHNDFTPHDKSMKLSRLAAHTADMPTFMRLILTAPPLDLADPNAPKPHVFETSAQNLAAFDTLAAALVATMKTIPDAAFTEGWTLVYGNHPIYSGDRYSAYRSMGLNHLVHHRAQLGVYLRLVGVPVPKTYGPSADEQ